MPVAIITGASRGLGRALAGELAGRGWDLVLDGRDADVLRSAARELAPGRAEGAAGTTAPVTASGPHTIPAPGDTEDSAPEAVPGARGGADGEPAHRGGVAAAGGGRRVWAVAGDVRSPGHRAELVAAARELGGGSGPDLLVNNASALGAAPLVPLAELPPEGLREALETNVAAPFALVTAVLPDLRAAGGAVLNISSDAAVEAYPTWGGYGASKAALDHLSAVLAVEEPAVRVWWADPGDLRTELYAAAVPDDPDFGERPLPERVAPALLRLLDGPAASGRYVVGELADGDGRAAAGSSTGAATREVR